MKKKHSWIDLHRGNKQHFVFCKKGLDTFNQHTDEKKQTSAVLEGSGCATENKLVLIAEMRGIIYDWKSLAARQWHSITVFIIDERYGR